MTDGWVVDKSALARFGRSPDGEMWAARTSRGLVRITVITLLEVGYSARSATDWHASIALPPVASMPVENLTPRMEARAVEIQGLLAQRGHHRAPSIPDLLVAAVAEASGLTVLHVDKAFDLIAEITGQPVERLRI
ncbi:PIN domain nuclease [Skermania sp. ID1734]|nr:PIN domain nuclease [Skermania sp. ID1734]TSD94127.1 PIN domain nuclease [Skermania sp. ID1734]